MWPGTANYRRTPFCLFIYPFIEMQAAYDFYDKTSQSQGFFRGYLSDAHSIKAKKTACSQWQCPSDREAVTDDSLWGAGTGSIKGNYGLNWGRNTWSSQVSPSPFRQCLRREAQRYSRRHRQDPDDDGDTQAGDVIEGVPGLALE